MGKSILWVVAAVGMASAPVLGQATSFTYQGQLKQQGQPLTELVDMQFLLFDSDTAETPIAEPLIFDGQASDPVQVSNGLFSVELDFGPGALELGQWLEVEVRSPHDPSDTGPYTTLTPRAHITAAPFALSVPGLASTTEGLEISGDVHTVGQIAASAYTSNSPLIFKVNPLDMECARFDDANCYLGIGTDAPQARLHVGGIPGVDGIMFPDGSIQTTAAGLGGGDGFWTAGGTNIFNNNGGNVGIGITDPSFKLDVRSSTGFGARLGMQGAGGGALVVASNPNDNKVYVEGYNSTDNGSAAEMLIAGFQGGQLPKLTIAAAKVGIGAPNSSTSAMEISGQDALQLTGTQPYITLNDYTLFIGGAKSYIQGVDGGVNLITQSRVGQPAPFFVQDGSNNVGMGDYYFDPVRQLHVLDSSVFPARFEGADPTASVVEFRSATSDNTWEYGVSGTTPPFGLGAGDMYLYRQGNSEPGLTISRDDLVASIRCADFKIGHPTRRGSPGRALVDNGDHLVINYNSDWNFTYVHGRLKVGVLEITGADVAEKFPSSDDDVEPGTVMEIDPGRAGGLRVARAAYNPRVAGVVSGAGNIPVGAVLGNLPGHEDAPPIALSGRVWVRCDASRVAIAPGDLLTTSEIPGLAMKAVDRSRAYGAILGKAMTALHQGERGLVLVLVNLQ